MFPEQIVVLSLICLTAVSNLPKLYYMLGTDEYRIFPWQKNGHVTKTSHWWIAGHIVVSLVLLISIFLHMGVRNYEMKNNWKFVFLVACHSLFFSFIMLNGDRLGKLSSNVAMFINFGATITLSLLLMFDYMLIYTILLCLPVIYESFLFVWLKVIKRIE